MVVAIVAIAFVVRLALSFVFALESFVESSSIFSFAIALAFVEILSVVAFVVELMSFSFVLSFVVSFACS